MPSHGPLNVLVLASQCKGERFLARCHQLGCRVHVLTKARLLSEPWPREVLADVHAIPDNATMADIIRVVTALGRHVRLDRLVPLDDFDVEVTAGLREHLRMPGMGESAARFFRDKLAMRTRAAEQGIPIPPFCRILNHADITDFITDVPGPWMLKPRSQASAAGIRKIHSGSELWTHLERLGDEQSYFLLERYIPGDVFHVDSLVSEGRVVFAEAHRCGRPPFDVAHQGGVWSTMTMERGSGDERALKDLNERVLTRLGLVRGTAHTEFIRGHDGQWYFMETAARVGGAYVSDVVEAATGINLWQEWANIEVGMGQEPYVLPPTRQDHAGVAITLARQEWPDYAGFDAPEIVIKVRKYHHAGVVVCSHNRDRLMALMADYIPRLVHDYTAVAPAPDRAE